MCDLVIAFDADDTLWHNETLFSVTQERFRQLLAPYQQDSWTGQELYETEVRNLEYFGYGIKGFTLSMIETAIQITEGRVQARDIQAIVDFAKEMLRAPVQLIEGVEATITALVQAHRLMLITKGDLFDQETKIAESGLAQHFTHVEIVRDKTEDSYRAILHKHRISAEQFVMVGNSLRSDVLPVLALGARAVHIPYHVTWAHEHVAPSELARAGYIELDHIDQLPGYIAKLCRTV